jgi:hypothetical protein
MNTGMKAASVLLSAVASAFCTIGSAAAADMPANPPPPNGYNAPPAEEGYVAPPPAYAYPPAPVYRYYYAPPPVAVVPGPYYVRPYYGWGYGRPYYGPYARGYGRYGYWR